MPHCIIECSTALLDKFPSNTFNHTVFNGALASELFQENAIKVRTYSCAEYLVGNTDAHFLHVTAKILSGRTTEQKSHLSKAILSKLTELEMSNVSITVEVIDIHTESYAKLVL